MPVKFRCPECHRLIAVPHKLVGKTINCPHNGCLVTVRASDVDFGHSSSVGNGRQGHAHGAGPSAEELRALHETPPGGVLATSEATLPMARPAASGGWIRRNVARFIPASGSASAANLVVDGRLPELQLQDGNVRRSAEEGEGTNPLVLVGVLCLSLVMSTALLLVDFEPPRSQQGLQQQARKRLAQFYQPTSGPLQVYQQHLRDAQRAHSRGDYETERQMYRRVLRLLRAEGRGRYSSLTRTPSEDRELERLLSVLLSQE